MKIGVQLGGLGLALAVVGCGLIPKRVEIGQSKVKAVPEKSAKAVETEKQAAQFIATKTSEARDEALRLNATNVVRPLTDARDAAYGLSYSLGAPARPWDSTGSELALKLGLLEAKLDRALDQYRKDTEPLVGKKIEGTGILQIPYFLWVGIVVGGLFLLWTALKVVGAIYPVVGVGVSGLSAAGRVGASTVTKAFEQVVAGGEAFKEAVKRADLDDKAKAWILDQLRRHQMVSQDTDVQELVRKITR